MECLLSITGKFQSFICYVFDFLERFLFKVVSKLFDNIR